jgi:sterol desaturase/sphingolipid hydroxylase (fatty acid hydroxylase superfamily)
MNLLGEEAFVRLIVFATVFAAMALTEMFMPRRHLVTGRSVRWLSNLVLAGINSTLVRVLIPIGATGLALVMQQRGWGLFNIVSVPTWAAIVLSVAIFDFIIYLQHVLFHFVPVLWRLHMVHHADLDFDVTTGLRFHTLEILLSMVIKMAAVTVLGPPPIAVLAFEVLLNATSMFSHGNVRFPLGFDRMLRLIVVTPDMHRVHHSVIAEETNSNFGFNLPWWDYLFGTYRAQPADGHDAMKIGLRQFHDKRVVRLPWMLALPFIRHRSDSATTRDGEKFGRTEGEPGGLDDKDTQLPTNTAGVN